ncbi:MAG: hypothetical protein MPK62_13720, partial [Alphaproteobacteria bacterium]|nr:hypothetical protein [Alphaproteobacteria bacterium]
MEKLTVGLDEKLKAKVLAHPTETILRQDDEDVNQDFISLKDISIVKPDKKIDIPENFNGMKVWKDLLVKPMQQGRCGSCWAFAAVSMLSDRFNIQSLGKMKINLSPVRLLLCNWRGKELNIKHPEDDPNYGVEQNMKAFGNAACFGNSLVDGCRYLYQIGASTQKCLPYDENFGDYERYQKLSEFTTTSKLPLCTSVSGPLSDMCLDFFYDSRTGIEEGTPQRFYKALHYYSIPGVKTDQGNEYFLRYDIYTVYYTNLTL